MMPAKSPRPASHLAAKGSAVPLAPLSNRLVSAAFNSGVIAGVSLSDLSKVSRIRAFKSSAVAGLLASVITRRAAEAASLASARVLTKVLTSGERLDGSAASRAAAMLAAGLREAAPMAALFW